MEFIRTVTVKGITNLFERKPKFDFIRQYQSLRKLMKRDSKEKRFHLHSPGKMYRTSESKYFRPLDSPHGSALWDMTLNSSVEKHRFIQLIRPRIGLVNTYLTREAVRCLVKYLLDDLDTECRQTKWSGRESDVTHFGLRPSCVEDSAPALRASTEPPKQGVTSVGCGLGFLEAMLSQHIDEVVAIDVFKTADIAEIAKLVLLHPDAQGCDYIQCAYPVLPIPSHHTLFFSFPVIDADAFHRYVELYRGNRIVFLGDVSCKPVVVPEMTISGYRRILCDEYPYSPVYPHPLIIVFERLCS
jgi:hypothetical protein